MTTMPQKTGVVTPVQTSTQQKPSTTTISNNNPLPPVQLTPLKLAVLGTVDSGKSTLVGALCTGQRDSGRGSLRALVAQHPHEAINGKTTSAAHHLFGYNKDGGHIFFNPLTKQQNDSTKTITSEETQGLRINKAKAWHHIVTNSTRVVTLCDLAGHQKYLRTSITHLVSYMPDLALILISPHTGISKMTIEHFSLCIALRIRVVVLVTKIDKAPLDVLKTLRVDLNNFIQFQAQRTPITIKGQNELYQVLGTSLGTVPPESYVPIFYLSSTTLQHFDLLHTYLSRVQPITWINNHNNVDTQNQVVSIDSIEDVHIAKRNEHQGGINGDVNNNITSTTPKKMVNNRIHDDFDAKSDNNMTSQLADNFHTLSLQSSNTTLDGSSNTATTNQSHILPHSITAGTTNMNSTMSTTTTDLTMSSVNGDNSILLNNNNNMNGVNSNTPVKGVKGGFNSQTMTIRDVGLPNYLQPIISGELRVEDRFYKSNAGLILSGTVTFGSFETDAGGNTNSGKNEQLILLGPFCSKMSDFIKTNNNTTQATADAIHHALKKNFKNDTRSVIASGKNNNVVSTNVTNTATAAGKNSKTSKNNANNNNNNDETQLDVEFIPVTVKSMQQYRTTINKATIGEGIGICIKYDEKTHKSMQKNFKYRSKYNHLKDWDKDDIFKGMVLLAVNPATIDISTLPINKLSSAYQMMGITTPNNTKGSTTNNTKGNTTALATTNKTAPVVPKLQQLTLKRYQFPYQLLLASSIDIDIEVLNASSCFRQGYQIVLHCSALVLPIIIETVLCVMDKSTSTNNNNKKSITVIEVADLHDVDSRENPSLNQLVQASTTQPQINNDILLRYGQRGILRCRFLHSPYVYIHEGEQVLLRDGSTRAIGNVSATFF